MTGRCVQGARFTSWDLDDLDDDDYLNFDEALEWAGAEDDVVEVEVDEADDVEEVAEEVADGTARPGGGGGAAARAGEGGAQGPPAVSEAGGAGERDAAEGAGKRDGDVVSGSDTGSGGGADDGAGGAYVFGFKLLEPGSVEYSAVQHCPDAGEPEEEDVRPLHPGMNMLVVAGVQKGGTTWMSSVLMKHPALVHAMDGYRCGRRVPGRRGRNSCAVPC